MLIITYALTMILLKKRISSFSIYIKKKGMKSNLGKQLQNSQHLLTFQ